MEFASATIALSCPLAYVSVNLSRNQEALQLLPHLLSLGLRRFLSLERRPRSRRIGGRHRIVPRIYTTRSGRNYNFTVAWTAADLLRFQSKIEYKVGRAGFDLALQLSGENKVRPAFSCLLLGAEVATSPQ